MEAILEAAYSLVRKHLQAHIFIQQLIYASHSSRSLDALMRKTKMLFLNAFPEGKNSGNVLEGYESMGPLRSH